jgi:diguanylate cyclase (GGDEF)-like protein
MSMRFLMAGYAVSLVLLLLGCRVISRSVQGLRGIRSLTGAALAGLICVILIACRPFAPTFLFVIVANLGILASFLLMYRATAEILCIRPALLTFCICVCVATLPGFLYYTYVGHQIVPRVLLSSGAIAIIAACNAVLLFHHRDPLLRYQISAQAWLLTALSSMHAVRCVLTSLYPPQDDFFLQLNFIQATFIYLNYILAMANLCGLLWLSLCAHRKDLHTMARTDGLTGLLNRRAFEESLQRDMLRASRTGLTLGMLLIDIDHFKSVNDLHGHLAGDEVIRKVGSTLQRGIRPADVLARFGGEEFVILMRDVGLREVETTAERLRLEIASLPGLTGAMAVTVSIGVTVSQHEDTPDSFLSRCDDALYLGKRSGRNIVVSHHRPPVNGHLPSAASPAPFTAEDAPSLSS